MNDTRILFRSVIALALTLSFTTACSGDPDGSNSGAAKTYGLPSGVLKTLTSVNTSLSANETTAGESITVACVGQPGDVVIPEPGFEATPSEGVTNEGSKMTATRSGTYQVACTLHDGQVKDESPEELLVKPGPAIKTIATLDINKVASGGFATVTCTAEDALGNKTTDGDWTVEVTPSDIGKVDGMKITGHKVGTGKVLCRLDGADDASLKSAELEVTVGAPAKTVASLDPEEFVAGGSSKVTCKVTDEAGNEHPEPGTMTVNGPADVTVNGDTVTTTVSGKHDITCTSSNGKLEEEPAVLKVKPDVAVSWELTTKKDKKVWNEGDVAVLVGLGKDQYGNDITWMPIQPPAQYTPKEGIKENQADGITKSYTFKADGVYTFTASLSEKEYGKEASAKLGAKSVTLKCDSHGPLVLISSPKRGASLKGAKTVKVKGTVVDELSGFKSFKIGEQEVTVGADGSFEIDRESAWGMNMLKWTATDEWENVSEGVQTYYYSTKWYKGTDKDKSGYTIPTGIGIWLSQQVIDSGNHDHKNPKDLATIAEVILGTLDFNQLLGAAAVPLKSNTGPLFFDGKALVKNVKMGDKGKNNGYPEFAITVIDGGMNLVGKIYNFSADLAIEAKWGLKPLPPAPLNQKANISAKAIEISFDLLMKLDPNTGKIKADTKNVDVNFNNLKISLNGLVGAVANWLLNAIGPALEATLEQVLKAVLQSTLGDQLGAALEGLAINQDLPLPPFIGDGDPTTLSLASNVGKLDFKPTKAQAGGIIVGLDASMTSETKIKHPNEGSIGRAGCLKPLGKEIFNPGLKFPLEAGLADDFINQLLFALWNGGALNLSIGEDALGDVDLTSFGVTKLSVDLDFNLPPLVNPCMSNEDLKVQIGDLQIHAKLNLAGTPIDIYLYAAMQATAKIDAVKNPKTGETELGFALKGIDYLELEITQINEEAKDLEDVFVTLIKTVMLPQLVDSLGAGLGSFPLPSIDLSTLSPSIPKGTAIALSIQKIENLDGYTYLRGALK